MMVEVLSKASMQAVEQRDVRLLRLALPTSVRNGVNVRATASTFTTSQVGPVPQLMEGESSKEFEERFFEFLLLALQTHKEDALNPASQLLLTSIVSGMYHPGAIFAVTANMECIAGARRAAALRFAAWLNTQNVTELLGKDVHVYTEQELQVPVRVFDREPEELFVLSAAFNWGDNSLPSSLNTRVRSFHNALEAHLRSTPVTITIMTKGGKKKEKEIDDPTSAGGRYLVVRSLLQSRRALNPFLEGGAFAASNLAAASILLSHTRVYVSGPFCDTIQRLSSQFELDLVSTVANQRTNVAGCLNAVSIIEALDNVPLQVKQGMRQLALMQVLMGLILQSKVAASGAKVSREEELKRACSDVGVPEEMVDIIVQHSLFEWGGRSKGSTLSIIPQQVALQYIVMLTLLERWDPHDRRQEEAEQRQRVMQLLLRLGPKCLYGSVGRYLMGLAATGMEGASDLFSRAEAMVKKAVKIAQDQKCKATPPLICFFLHPP